MNEIDNEIIAVDLYNQVLTGDICMTLRQKAADSDHIPCVIIRNNTPCYSIDQGGGKSACVILADVSPTLTTTHYGSPAVAYREITNERTDRL